MSPAQIQLPMNTAHQHAANAEDYLNSGHLIPAAEEESKAAEAFAVAIERTEDPSTKRTLSLLHDKHLKAAKELERKIAKLKSEGKDPNEPQKVENHPQTGNNRYNQPTPGPSRMIPSPPPPLADSQGTVDESFMLLAGQQSDPGDAFNQFWNIMQGMLDNLSQPVAFATIPLGGDDVPGTSTFTTASPRRRDSSLSSDTEPEEPMVSRWSRKLGISSSAKQTSSSSKISEPDFDDDFIDEGDDLSGSFYVIPSESSMAALKKENATLKSEIESIQKRLETTERVLQLRKEQDMQLRDSIVQASKEAQRAMGASLVGQRGQLAPDFASLNLNVPASALPIPGIQTRREGQYMRRVKELEEELRVVRIENEKNKAMIVKFRERWEKLKESAKRKKENRATAEAAQAVRERIVEEPEPEE